MSTTNSNGAIVALSGGQDSTTCLYYARQRYAPVKAVAFDYGQRHRVELECAADVAEGAGVDLVTFKVPALREMGASSLTNPDIAVSEDATDTGNTYAEARKLPSSFVPGRNLILLGLAASYGVTKGLDTLVTGVCQTDRAGYPDCRGEFIRALEVAIRVGVDHPGFSIDAPLLTRTKVQTWQLAHELDCLDVVVRDSHTCYEGKRDQLHAWGYGCGECPSCKVRASSFEEFQKLGELAQPITGFGAR